jgi:hypothetical protein
MPPLTRPDHPSKIKLRPREAELIGETEVLVIGGGPAGIGAAIGAADAGAKVILVERYGFLGGNATAASVNNLMSYYTHHYEYKLHPEINFYPQDHGQGEPVIAGVLSQLVDRMVKRGGAIHPSLATGYVTPFDSEIFKKLAEEMLDQHQVKFLYYALASGIIGEKEPEGVILETKSGPLAIKSQIMIDCTGSGDIAAWAGAPYEIGRESDGLTQPISLMFSIVNFDPAAFEEYVKQHPDDWNGCQGLKNLIAQATRDGKLNMPREDVLIFGMPHDRELNINCTRINKVSGINVWDLTYAEYLGRQQMQQIEAFFQYYVPGFKDTYIAQSGPQVDVRETRRIMGEYKLTAEDVLNAHKFPDVIARGAYPIDIHTPDGRGTVLMRVPPGEAYDIPLRCLIPLKVDRVIVAGRCISGTHEAQGSYRIMPIDMATGQAAGVCAALSIKNHKTPRTLEYQIVQKELLRQGANLRDIKMNE